MGGEEEVRPLNCSRRVGPCGWAGLAPLARRDNAALAGGGPLAPPLVPGPAHAAPAFVGCWKSGPPLQSRGARKGWATAVAAPSYPNPSIVLAWRGGAHPAALGWGAEPSGRYGTPGRPHGGLQPSAP